MRISSILAAVFIGAAYAESVAAVYIHLSLIEGSEYRHVFAGIVFAAAAILILRFREQ